jgi:hypothetical protein
VLAGVLVDNRNARRQAPDTWSDDPNAVSDAANARAQTISGVRAARSVLAPRLGLLIDRRNARHETRNMPSADEHALAEARDVQGEARDVPSLVASVSS